MARQKQVENVMQMFGMGYLQAKRHIEQREHINRYLRRAPNRR